MTKVHLSRGENCDIDIWDNNVSQEINNRVSDCSTLWFNVICVAMYLILSLFFSFLLHKVSCPTSRI